MARKRRRRKERSAPLPPGTTRVRWPPARLKAALRVLADVSAAAEQALPTATHSADEKQRRLLQFDAAILLRGSDALQAIRLLCAKGHWEFAASAVRQLFELVVNMEYLAEQPDREAASLVYANYGALQTLRLVHMNLLYDERAGRPADPNYAAQVESMLKHMFPTFRLFDAQGRVRWQKSWSGLSTRELAKQSKHSLRKDQYDLLFVPWSEQTHAAPAALVANIFPFGVDENVLADNVRTAETLAIATTLFLELWELLPHAPQADAAQRLRWTTRLLEEAQRHGSYSSRLVDADERDPA